MMKKNLLTTAAVSLVGLLFFLRFYKLYEFVTFLSDQGRDAIILKRIITFEHFPAIGAPSSVGQVYLGPFYYYLIAPFLGLFNFDPVGPAVGVALLSIVGIITAYLVIKKEVAPTVAVFFLALSTFSAVLTEYSRFSWNPNLLPYFSFFTLYFCYRWLEAPTIRKGIIFGTLLGFTIQLHYLGALLIVPIFLFVVWKIYDLRSIKKYLHSFASACLAFILSISPLIIFDLRHKFLNSRQFYKLFAEGELSSATAYHERLIDTADKLIQHGFQLSTSPLISIFVLLTILIIGILAFRQTKSRFILLHVFNILFYILSFSLLGGERLAHYYGPVILSLYVTFVSGIILVRSFQMKIILLLLIIPGFILLNVPKMYYLFEKGNNQIAHAKNVAAFLAEKIDHKPFNFATWPVGFGEDTYLYFLELDDMRPADRTKLEITDQMFVICGKEPCQIQDSPSWNISMFGNAMIVDQWQVDGLTIYQLKHQ